jgi:hypothetical protein
MPVVRSASANEKNFFMYPLQGSRRPITIAM